MNTEGPSSIHPQNPYANISTRSYKDALLQEATDTDSRLGINSFHLLSLLQKKNIQDTDDNSICSNGTNPKDNTTTWAYCRMRFQITLLETTPDTFMEDLSNHINKILEVININTPGVALVPWHTMQADEKDLTTVLSADPLEAVKYLYGFKAGLNKPCPQYFRIHIAFPATYTLKILSDATKTPL